MNQDNIFVIKDCMPHVMQEVICVKCCKRWLAIEPQELRLKDYECDVCGKGFVIKTGQELE